MILIVLKILLLIAQYTEMYKNLVAKQKKCSLCNYLKNPAIVDDGIYDSDQIGLWSLWQSNIKAKIVIVGQDWGDISYYKKWEGKDQPFGNPTNENLQKLVNNIGINIGTPRDTQGSIVFLTNLILCLKTGGLQGRVDDQWIIKRAGLKPWGENISEFKIEQGNRTGRGFSYSRSY